MDTRSRLVRRLATLPIAGLAVALALTFATAAGALPDNPNANPDAGTNANAGPNANANENASDHQVSGNAGTSGIVTSPQPLSTADDNGTGANVPGPYDSTRDGSPSMNGSENGLAVGQPCAGCVGQADNKNPPGQLPGGSDPNAGYECDRNQGIGQTNPAHTGCVSETVNPPGVVPGVTPNTPAASVADVAASPASAGLPRTGSGIAVTVAAGLLLLAMGAVALGVARARGRAVTI